MPFCSKCGAEIPADAKHCPSCGAATESAKKADPTDFSDKISSFNNTADTTAEFDPADIESNKVMAVLAYLSWLVLIPLFAAKNSKFARYHVNQGLVLAIAEIAFWVAQSIIVTVLSAIFWALGAIVSTILGLLNLVFLVFAIIGIVNAINGKAKELPIIGRFKLIK